MGLIRNALSSVFGKYSWGPAPSDMEKIPFDLLEKAVAHVPLDFPTGSRKADTAAQWFTVSSMISNAPGMADNPDIDLVQKAVREVGLHIAASDSSSQVLISHKTLHGMTCLNQAVRNAVGAYLSYESDRKISNAFLHRMSARQDSNIPFYKLHPDKTAGVIQEFHGIIAPTINAMDRSYLARSVSMKNADSTPPRHRPF